MISQCTTRKCINEVPKNVMNGEISLATKFQLLSLFITCVMFLLPLFPVHAQYLGPGSLQNRSWLLFVRWWSLALISRTAWSSCCSRCRWSAFVLTRWTFAVVGIDFVVAATGAAGGGRIAALQAFDDDLQNISENSERWTDDEVNKT